MPLSSPRSLFVLAFLASLGLLGAALYLQHWLGSEACPLCVVQRLCLLAFGLSCLVAALHGPGILGRRIYAGLALVFAVLGGGAAARQVWLQGIPADQLPACLPSLDYMMEVLPLQNIVRLVLQGSAECGAVSWTLFGMSASEWNLLGFVALGALGLLQLLRRA